MRPKISHPKSIGRRKIRESDEPVNQSLPRLLTVDLAAPMLGLNARQVREQIWRGNLPHVRIGRHVRIPLRALEQMLEEQLASSSDKTKSRSSKEEQS